MQISNSVISSKDGGNVDVDFKNVNSEKEGKIYIAVFNKKETFMTKNYYKNYTIDVNNENMNLSMTIENLPYGEYVISAYHDTNDNQMMDFDDNGMPQEAWAMSGSSNPYARPSWETAKIEVKEGIMKIDLYFFN
jgi:uncharacterized protein (DUF2141 family)